MSAYSIADLIGYLAGRWRLVRAVEDRASGSGGRFEGELVCSCGDDPARLIMRESGALRWAGANRPAFRTTRLVIAGAPGTGRVLFDDGRFFHDLDLRTGEWNAEHSCAPDTYYGSFRARGAHAWAYEWRVSGPGKDLYLATELIRARH